jgi:hypothetical protein
MACDTTYYRSSRAKEAYFRMLRSYRQNLQIRHPSNPSRISVPLSGNDVGPGTVLAFSLHVKYQRGINVDQYVTPDYALQRLSSS